MASCRRRRRLPLVGVAAGGGGAGAERLLLLLERGEGRRGGRGEVVDGGGVCLGDVEVEVLLAEEEEHAAAVDAEAVVAQPGALHVALLVGAEPLPLEPLPLQVVRAHLVRHLLLLHLHRAPPYPLPHLLRVAAAGHRSRQLALQLLHRGGAFVVASPRGRGRPPRALHAVLVVVVPRARRRHVVATAALVVAVVVVVVVVDAVAAVDPAGLHPWAHLVVVVVVVIVLVIDLVAAGDVLAVVLVVLRARGGVLHPKGRGRRRRLARGGRGGGHGRGRRVVEAGGGLDAGGAGAVRAVRGGGGGRARVVVGAHLAEEEVLGAEQLARLVLGLVGELVHGVEQRVVLDDLARLAAAEQVDDALVPLVEVVELVLALLRRHHVAALHHRPRHRLPLALLLLRRRLPVRAVGPGPAGLPVPRRPRGRLPTRGAARRHAIAVVPDAVHDVDQQPHHPVRPLHPRPRAPHRPGLLLLLHHAALTGAVAHPIVMAGRLDHPRRRPRRVGRVRLLLLLPHRRHLLLEPAAAAAVGVRLLVRGGVHLRVGEVHLQPQHCRRPHHPPRP
ncbi:Os01g0318202, partial [Oryza sativa Japonica Group]